jgi:hypothetical protein
MDWLMLGGCQWPCVTVSQPVKVIRRLQLHGLQLNFSTAQKSSS